MNQERILVTGGTGYIGSHTAVELITTGYEVEILDNLYNSKIEVLDRIKEITGIKPKFHQVDLRDAGALSQVFKSNSFNSVIHFAGLKAVGESVVDPLRYYENNVGGSINLLECMQAYDVKRIVFSSSATVYGVQESPCYVESMQTGHLIPSPYGRTKFVIEEILKDVCAADPSFSAISLRYFNPIGAHPSGLLGEDPNDKPNNLMPIILKVATGQLPELAIYGDDYPTPDGTCIRDYIHVVDLAKGHLAALEHINPGIQIYNLGSGKGTSVKEIVETFCRVSGINLPHRIAARRPGDLPEFYADPGLAHRKLRWQTIQSIEDAIESSLRFIEHFGFKLI